MKVIRRTAILFSVLIGLIFFLQSCNFDSPVSGSNPKTNIAKKILEEICVYVSYCDGTSLEGATVEIKDGNGNIVFQGVTGPDGKICFNAEDIANGIYNAVAIYGDGMVQQKFYYNMDSAQPVNVYLCFVNKK